MAGGGRGYFNLAGLLRNVFPFGKDRAFVSLDFRKRQAGNFCDVGGCCTGADPRLNVPGGHRNGRPFRRRLRSRPARRPERFIDRQPEHLTAGPAQQEVSPVVVHAYNP
jgi:hypothetical protein